MTSEKLASSLAVGTPWSGGAVANSANCIQADVRADGSGTYQCMVSFTDGQTASKQVTVDTTGAYISSNRWVRQSPTSGIH